ncbi:MAG: hypothetical protein JWN44_4287, partial [Myxococcales bacterium]|nr:hypothetical protein [Myxococcales bacterium]
GAHLHFSVSLRDGGRAGSERYIDPEPMLRDWTLPSLPAVASYTPR